MNKNDQFHGAEFEVNARAISDEEMEAVAGGSMLGERCPYCGDLFYPANYQQHVKACAAHPSVSLSQES